MSNRYTFWRLLLEKHIVIPIIQRDFAQGRDGQEYVRKNFLEQLGNALGLGDATTAEAELDFVYGTEYLLNKEDGKDVIEMLPLDGQQRLTTLWLLHFYVAYRAKKLPQVKDTLRKFTYETST